MASMVADVSDLGESLSALKIDEERTALAQESGSQHGGSILFEPIIFALGVTRCFRIAFVHFFLTSLRRKPLSYSNALAAGLS